MGFPSTRAVPEIVIGTTGIGGVPPSIRMSSRVSPPSMYGYEPAHSPPASTFLTCAMTGSPEPAGITQKVSACPAFKSPCATSLLSSLNP